MKVYQPNGKAATGRPVLQCSHFRNSCRGSRPETIHILPLGSSFFPFAEHMSSLAVTKLPATSLRRLTSARVRQPVTTTFSWFSLFLDDLSFCLHICLYILMDFACQIPHCITCFVDFLTPAGRPQPTFDRKQPLKGLDVRAGT